MSHGKQIPGRTCSYCTRPLELVPRKDSAAAYGYRGEGLFCGLACGYEYGREVALEANKSHGGSYGSDTCERCGAWPHGPGDCG